MCSDTLIKPAGGPLKICHQKNVKEFKGQMMNCFFDEQVKKKFLDPNI